MERLKTKLLYYDHINHCPREKINNMGFRFHLCVILLKIFWGDLRLTNDTIGDKSLLHRVIKARWSLLIFNMVIRISIFWGMCVGWWWVDINNDNITIEYVYETDTLGKWLFLYVFLIMICVTNNLACKYILLQVIIVCTNLVSEYVILLNTSKMWSNIQ